MWWAFDQHEPSILIVSDPRIGLDDSLIDRLEHCSSKQLQLVAHQLFEGQWTVTAAAYESSRNTTREAEEPFRDRALSGEHRLSSPPADMPEFLLGPALIVQILRGPDRWAKDLHQCVLDFTDTLIRDRKRAKKARAATASRD